MNVRSTWFLRTADGREIYRDLRGIATFEDGPNIPYEFIEGQHPRADKEFLAEEISDFLGVECVWVRGPDWISER
jgi:hypothetical protein